MDITKARFAGSAASVEQTPKLKLPEFAFIGRSNVGKSSLINMLCNNGALAKTSSRPGKTLLINHFLINDAWYIVDLPGYGYAKISKEAQARWQKYLEEYDWVSYLHNNHIAMKRLKQYEIIDIICNKFSDIE